MRDADTIWKKTPKCRKLQPTEVKADSARQNWPKYRAGDGSAAASSLSLHCAPESTSRRARLPLIKVDGFCAVRRDLTTQCHPSPAENAE